MTPTQPHNTQKKRTTLVAVTLLTTGLLLLAAPTSATEPDPSPWVGEINARINPDGTGTFTFRTLIDHNLVDNPHNIHAADLIKEENKPANLPWTVRPINHLGYTGKQVTYHFDTIDELHAIATETARTNFLPDSVTDIAQNLTLPEITAHFIGDYEYATNPSFTHTIQPDTELQTLLNSDTIRHELPGLEKPATQTLLYRLNINIPGSPTDTDAEWGGNAQASWEYSPISDTGKTLTLETNHVGLSGLHGFMLLASLCVAGAVLMGRYDDFGFWLFGPYILGWGWLLGLIWYTTTVKSSGVVLTGATALIGGLLVHTCFLWNDLMPHRPERTKNRSERHKKCPKPARVVNTCLHQPNT